MALGRRLFADETNEAAERAGNHRVTVYGPTQSIGGESVRPGVVWSGWCGGWAETASGGLSLRRHVHLDADHPAQVEMVTVAAGSWSRIETTGFVFDLDSVLAQEAQTRDAETAGRLGLTAAPNGGPNRMARRHPGN